MKGLKYIIILFCISGTHVASAQVFGGTPASIRWKQINTPAVRVIYPAGIDSIAGDVAAIAGQLDRTAAFSLGDRHRKVNIVLHNQTTASNGYVGLGPFRSEFYLTPLQNSFRLGSLPWHKQLTIHEFRHVEQYNNFNVGLSKVFRLLFGEEGQGLANGMAIPNWFFEGDAVFNETRVSEQGRGRLPYFYNGLRVLWAADKQYSWMKLRNGSLQDYTPDHYQLGYLLVAYGYEQYGEDFWRRVTKDAASYKGLFYPFQQAVERYAGKNYKTFRQDALNYFKKRLDSVDHYTGWPLRVRHPVTNENYPVFINDSTWVFVKSSYKERPAFVMHSKGTEKRLRMKDISLDDHFSYRNNKIVYAAYRPDLRWGWRNYSVINVLDVRTGKQHTITRQSRYFAPDINAAGDKIAAVQEGADGKSVLHILNAENGQLLAEVPDRDNLTYTYPRFYEDTKLISAVRNREGQMSLGVINIADGKTNMLLPFSFNVIGFPMIQHDTLYFTASAGYADRLYALDMRTRKLFLVSANTPGIGGFQSGGPATSDRRGVKNTPGIGRHQLGNSGIPDSPGVENPHGIGQYQPAVSNNSILFSTFTASGFKLEKKTKERTRFIPVSKDSFIATPDFFINSLCDGEDAIAGSDVHPGYPATLYRKTTGLFNFHSLEPLFSDPDYRFSLVGENVLNTLQSELYLNYNRNEQFKQIGFNGTYGGWFPYISLGTSYILDRRARTEDNKTVYWNEAQVSGGLSIPLNLSRGRTSTGLTFGADYAYRNVSYTGAFKSQGGYSFGLMHGYVSFTSQVQKAVQHIYPRLAQSVRVDYSRAVSLISAEQLVASGNLYLPGLAANHHLVINGAWHARDTLQEYFFSNRFPFSRGYTAPDLERMVKWGVNYHLPLFYPDAGVANILYLQRVRANLFFDNTIGRVKYTSGARRINDFRSAGTEIFFDTKWWNEFPISFGFRYSHLLDPDLFGGIGNSRFAFILPVNLFQR